MKQFIDYIPLLVFISVWTIDERVVSVGGFEHTIGGIYSAAEFLLLTSVLVYGSLFLVQKSLDKFQWITLAAVVIACIPTVIFKNIAFLKWKAPIVNWIFAAIFYASKYVSDKPAIEHMMGHAVDAPKELWYRLNTIWILFFLLLGAINLAVAFGLSEATWVKFKVFGNLGITLVFVMGQMPMLAKYIEVEEDGIDAPKEESI